MMKNISARFNRLRELCKTAILSGLVLSFLPILLPSLSVLLLLFLVILFNIGCAIIGFAFVKQILISSGYTNQTDLHTYFLINHLPFTLTKLLNSLNSIRNNSSWISSIYSSAQYSKKMHEFDYMPDFRHEIMGQDNNEEFAPLLLYTREVECSEKGDDRVEDAILVTEDENREYVNMQWPDASSHVLSWADKFDSCTQSMNPNLEESANMQDLVHMIESMTSSMMRSVEEFTFMEDDDFLSDPALSEILPESILFDLGKNHADMVKEICHDKKPDSPDSLDVFDIDLHIGENLETNMESNDLLLAVQNDGYNDDGISKPDDNHDDDDDDGVLKAEDFLTPEARNSLHDSYVLIGSPLFGNRLVESDCSSGCLSYKRCSLSPSSSSAQCSTDSSDYASAQTKQQMIDRNTALGFTSPHYVVKSGIGDMMNPPMCTSSVKGLFEMENSATDVSRCASDCNSSSKVSDCTSNPRLDEMLSSCSSDEGDEEGAELGSSLQFAQLLEFWRDKEKCAMTTGRMGLLSRSRRRLHTMLSPLPISDLEERLGLQHCNRRVKQLLGDD